MQKKILSLMAVATLWQTGLMAQEEEAEDPNSYFVFTNNLQAADSNNAKDIKKGKGGSVDDYIGQNFPHHPVCEWVPGMRFMVRPTKKDMITGVFRDAKTERRVSCGVLRNKIMIYDGYVDDEQNDKCRIYFVRQDNAQRYYYEIPGGVFASYCEQKTGVPTLAYLDDVDQARRLFIGKKATLKSYRYRVDTKQSSEGFDDVRKKVGTTVVIKKVGIGSRSFPVKIVVEDSEGHQFYQEVTISQTNTGLREDELGLDNTRFTFDGSFELVRDSVELVKATNADMVGRKVYLLNRTEMSAAGKYVVDIQKYSGFVIEKVEKQFDSEYVTLHLRSLNDQKLYTKSVIMREGDDSCEECFKNIFGDGDPLREDSERARQMRKELKRNPGGEKRQESITRIKLK
ncbi:MAG: hypothetical protein K5928_00275 [Prevotella sp.]|nr:hypothetical protein [Prevotella sp.]